RAANTRRQGQQIAAARAVPGGHPGAGPRAVGRGGTPPSPSRPGLVTSFRLLGPVEAVDDSGPVELSATKLRTVLAVLLLAQSRVVSDDRLVELLWGDAPPATAAAQIQTYMSRLRQRLGPDVEVVRHHPGYLLRTPPPRV